MTHSAASNQCTRYFSTSTTSLVNEVVGEVIDMDCAEACEEINPKAIAAAYARCVHLVLANDNPATSGPRPEKRSSVKALLCECEKE